MDRIFQATFASRSFKTWNLKNNENLSTILKMRPNLLVYSDGGCRNDGHAVFAWVVYAVVQRNSAWESITLAMSGTLLYSNASSFQTEMLGIEGATAVVEEYGSFLLRS